MGARLVGPIMVTAWLLAACAPTRLSSAPATMPPPPSATPAGSPTAAPPATPVASGAVAIDTTLLTVLPSSVAGLAVTETPEEEQAALSDPMLAMVGSAIASGLAIEPATGQFVYAVVVRLRPGVMTDTAFRDWRDSYDEGACSQSSGVAGHAEAKIDGRTVFIGTCAGGVRTYHAWLAPQGLMVSASAVGDRRLGELLVDNLSP